ncbi:hypothetical protein PPYR_02977 [Photinus pyralis]|uniref:Fatty acyl-CoA reductase n=1 Tax=Photinus pyralis TaxID=7054 RepID=A0A1Y1LHX9_PHOPY|nr:fatty acyl-CoA reductase wat [Photinus pyralis]KAB0791177.1 hypothetical protein PPYR_02977 [Photinus pyralis]
MPGLIDTPDNEAVPLTPIQKFYSGANVFVTGGTGFLGKMLIEKLLRSCPDISTLYVLVRSKKGRNMHTRVEELFDDKLFDSLRSTCPKFRHKVVGIAGDCSLTDLGLTIQDRQLLIQEVSIVFHVAATVRFDEKLKLAMAINVKGPREVLYLCREMINLKSVIHVSTAYSNCNLSMIEEKFYPPPLDSKKLIMLTDTIQERLLDKVTPILLDQWPNTYTYTKSVAEDIVRLEGEGLPVGIFRPAVVVSAYKEPMKGWINNMYGPTGVCAGAGTGVLRTIHCDASVNANIVPVDMCVNSLIANAWDVAETYALCKKQQREYQIPICHYESSNDQPLYWGKFMELSALHGMEVPSIKAIWYYCLTLQATRLGYNFTVFFLHILPAAICDFALLCVGKSPRLLKIYKKIHKFTAVISYFCTRNWQFKSSRYQEIIAKMTQEDRRIFFQNLKELDWEEYFKEYIKGIRIYLIGDPEHTMPAAKAKWQRLFWLHQAFKVLLAFVILRTLWAVLCMFMS